METPETNIKLSFSPPATSDFLALRKSVGWSSPEFNVLEQSLQNSMFWVCYYSNKKLVSCARIVGDGHMYFYIQDVIVEKCFQGQGLAHKMMVHVEHYIKSNCPKGSTIGLLASLGKEGFYERYGYSRRDGEFLGLGLCKFI